MPSIIDALDWHDLDETKTYHRREYQYVPGRSLSDCRDGTLTIRQSKGKRAGSMWESDSYGVEEQSPVGPPNPGRVFLLVNDTDTEQPDVYETFVSGADKNHDRCSCRAGICRAFRCKHLDSLRDMTTPKGDTGTNPEPS